MAPKGRVGSAISLVQFVPTEEELAATRSMLSAADPKAKKSKTNAMMAFLATNKSADGNEGVMALPTGPEKSAYVERYMAFQAAKKSGRMSSSRVNATEKVVFQDKLHWNEFKCMQEVGEATFTAWVASGKLGWGPCPVTGSTEEHMRIYYVPKNWTREAQTEKDSVAIDIDGVVTAQDVEDFASMRVGSSSDAVAVGAGGVVGM